MKCVVNWILLRIRVRSRNTQPHLKVGLVISRTNEDSQCKVGLGISRTNADSQWNPVLNAFHQIFGCANETIPR